MQENLNQTEIVESEGIQAIVYQAAIQAASVIVVLRGTDA